MSLPNDQVRRLPFRALGHTGDRYYFLPDRGGVPISLPHPSGAGEQPI